MITLIENIAERKFDEANKRLNESLQDIVQRKLNEMRKMVAAQMDEEVLEEGPRISIVRGRIRGGKIQRRKKVSNVPGFTLRGGKMVRMSASERRKRRLGAKRAKIKVRAKRTQMLRKRKLSLQKRKRLGL